MRTFAAVAALIALLPLPADAGGKACQVSESAIPTPGLRELAMGSTSNPLPDNAWLKGAQIDRLAEADTHFRLALRDLDEQLAKLPAGKGAPAADLAGKPLPELVTAFLSRATRGRAILIDTESAGEFWLADDEAMAASKGGEKSRWCALCIAVRTGMEARFQYEESDFGALTEEQKKKLAALGQKRDDLGRKWAAILKEELTAPQLEWLRDAQMRWLKATLKTAVTNGVKSLGARTCEACSEEAVQEKCEFCAIVTKALEAAKREISR
ncbi:MAG: hypothetical protein FD180_4011 [Planctomycetota bacterium]|nr:MAG: hypothetical protein FD180_4011 [Planctomycetota bacterium]